MFDAKVLIKRLPSFSVPKITVIRHVQPISCSKRGRPEQSYEKNARTLNYPMERNTSVIKTSMMTLDLASLMCIKKIYSSLFGEN